METNFENLGLYDLTENETYEIDGGEHLEWIDGKLVWVGD